MNGMEIFARILKEVCTETGISTDTLLSPEKREEVVDARYLLIRMLIEEGLYPKWIAKRIGRTARCVNYVIRNFDDRIISRKLMRINYENLKKQSGKQQETNSGIASYV